jgi:hypothetical protein
VTAFRFGKKGTVHNGMLLQNSFARKEKLLDAGMELPFAMGKS